jgi:hypothetical protein
MDEISPQAVYARADFVYWSKAAYWKIPEAVALLFGEDPQTVQRKMIKGGRRYQPFAKQYDKVCDLANRAVRAKQLSALVSPGVFLAWARRNKIDYPAELERQVLLHGHRIVDWQICYEKLKKRCSEKEREIAVLTHCRADLIHQVKDLEEQLQQARPKPLGTRERESLMKLIIGMAVASYQHDPKANRSGATQAICDDLAELGIPMDPDTVRKWLREAAQILPQDPSIDT